MSEGKPFGEVRVAVQTGLLLKDIKPTLQQWITIALIALVLSTVLAAAGERRGSRSDPGHQRSTGPHLGRGIRHGHDDG